MLGVLQYQRRRLNLQLRAMLRLAAPQYRLKRKPHRTIPYIPQASPLSWLYGAVLMHGYNVPLHSILDCGTRVGLPRFPSRELLKPPLWLGR
jgi:hypothetical protein